MSAYFNKDGTHKTNKNVYTLKIDAETHRNIKIEAAILGITMTEFMAKAVEDFIKNNLEDE